MKPEIKQRWLDALRSGDYKKGKHVLRTGDNRFCCLGVLCDIAAQDGLGEWDFSTDNVGSFLGRGLVPPHEVAIWAGLRELDPLVLSLDNDKKVSLSGVNDNSETFESVIELIEKRL